MPNIIPRINCPIYSDIFPNIIFPFPRYSAVAPRILCKNIVGISWNILESILYIYIGVWWVLPLIRARLSWDTFPGKIGHMPDIIPRINCPIYSDTFFNIFSFGQYRNNAKLDMQENSDDYTHGIKGFKQNSIKDSSAKSSAGVIKGARQNPLQRVLDKTLFWKKIIKGFCFLVISVLMQKYS